jgi:hypothetical protein
MPIVVVIIFSDWFFHSDAFGRPRLRPNNAVEFWDMSECLSALANRTGIGFKKPMELLAFG